MRCQTNLVLCLQIYLVMILWKPQGVHSLQQLYHKSFNDSYPDEVTYDPKLDIYPVIQLSTDCPYHPLTSCPDAFHQRNIEEFCSLQSKCPNGTQPQCVENKEYVWKEVRLICSPIQNCVRDARNIVYMDRSKPNIYQLGKESCEDGYYHTNNNNPKDNYCFSSCHRNDRVQVFRHRTAKRGPIVYCNYQLDYCYVEGPKLFELKDAFSPCYKAYERGYRACIAGSGRFPDCTCQALCADGLIRDPADNFKCKKQSELFASMDIAYLRNALHISQHSSGFRLRWNFPHEDIATVEAITVAYRGADDSTETYLNYTITDDDKPDYTDIEGLFPGNVYSITVKIMFNYEGIPHTVTLKHLEPTQPNPVYNLTAEMDRDNINLQWLASSGSRQDHYRVEYRMVRRNRKPSWAQSVSPNCTYALHDAFPGEEYEFRVFSISNGSSSAKTSTVLIVPPLPPEKLQYHFPSSSSTMVTLFWFHNETRSHVEKWHLRFSSSDGDEGQKDVPPPENGNWVEVTFVDFRHGQAYTVFVQGLVADIVSTKPVRIDFKMHEMGVHITVYIIIVILVLLAIGVGALLVLRICTKVPVVRRIRNYFNIDRVETNINCTNGDLNINDAGGALLGGNHSSTTSIPDLNPVLGNLGIVE